MKRYTLVILYVIIFGFSLQFFYTQSTEPEVEDQSRLLPVKMKTIKATDSLADMQKLVRDANANRDPISIAGTQHSQGGHTVYPDGILLDMKPYNKILEFDADKKLITVQSGATWSDIQEFINPFGLSLKVSQSQNIFTVGGSVSVNAHGLDIRNHGLIDTVESFRLLDARGEIVTVSRDESPELFYATIGGYGLFGVILDLTIHLVEDELYQIRSKTFQYDEYASYFQESVLSDEKIKMHLARISVAPDSFFEEMYVIDYEKYHSQEQLVDYSELKQETLSAVPKFFLGLSRINKEGKNIFWDTQKTYTATIDDKLISRNNVMRSDSEFMEYNNPSKTEILQEYFIPVDQFTGFIDDLRETLKNEQDFNLLNVTIRYVEKNEEALLSYAKEDMFSFVLLINQGTAEEDLENTERVVQRMIDITLAHDGSYYLPYYGYPTKSQFRQAYPRLDEFIELKKRYDPENRFMNLFYEEYIR